MRNRWVTLLFLLLINIAPLMSGCGGGSAGTGTGEGISLRTLHGNVLTTTGNPIAGATLTIVQTGESTTTDQNGVFTLATESQSDAITVTIEKGALSSEVPVMLQTDISNETTVSISVNPQSGSASVLGVDVRVKIIGECDRYFENGGPIRQANQVPVGTHCPLQVSVRASRGGLPNRTFTIQYRRCEELGHPWHTLASGETGDNGVGTLQFPYVSDDEHCLYRVLTPLNDNEIKPLEFDILTFAYQQFKNQ